MDWSQVHWARIILETSPVALTIVGAAVVGFALGRLIRGRPYIGRHIGGPRNRHIPG